MCSSIRRAVPSAKNVGAHSPMKIPHRSARSTPALSYWWDTTHEATDAPMDANPAVNSIEDDTPILCSVLIMTSPDRSAITSVFSDYPDLRALSCRVVQVAADSNAGGPARP